MFQYPGIGLSMPAGNYGGAGSVNGQPEPLHPGDPANKTVAADEVTMPMPVNNAAKTVLTVLYASAGTTVTVQLGSDSAFTNVTDLDTIDISDGTMATWTYDKPLMGVIRVNNDGMSDLTAVYGNTLVATVG